jgi:membrane-bound lytic murein transglycosylase A
MASASNISAINNHMQASPVYPNSMRALCVAVCLALLSACNILTPAPEEKPIAQPSPTPTGAAPFTLPDTARATKVAVTELPNFAQDKLIEGWRAWLASCEKIGAQAAWREVCALARTLRADEASIRNYFATRFDAYALSDAQGKSEGMLTGYYEPFLKASLTRKAPFVVPLYGVPDDLVKREATGANGAREVQRGRMENGKLVPYFTRGELTANHPSLRGKEIAWVEDVIDAFFLQVQGSGRLQLADGRVLRVGFADMNGHPYRSIGRTLLERGELKPDNASAQAIKAWARANPSKTPELLATNPSFVFFRFLPNPPENAIQGPLGTLAVPLTERRSIAVDTRFVPLGAPVWMSAQHQGKSIDQLALAQDTGSAIKGEVRADYFWGAGDAAGEEAGRMKAPLRLWVLWPKL